MSDCPVCDWRFSSAAEAWAIYRPGAWLPLMWDGGLREARSLEQVHDTMLGVATAVHVAQQHPALIEGAWVLDRWLRLPGRRYDHV